MWCCDPCGCVGDVCCEDSEYKYWQGTGPWMSGDADRQFSEFLEGRGCKKVADKGGAQAATAPAGASLKEQLNPLAAEAPADVPPPAK